MALSLLDLEINRVFLRKLAVLQTIPHTMMWERITFLKKGHVNHGRTTGETRTKKHFYMVAPWTIRPG